MPNGEGKVSVDKFSGCLVGECLGDALGFIVEGHPPGHCQKYVEEVMRANLAHTMRRGPFAFGQYSDDSQLARELLQSYVARGSFDPEDYAKRIAAIFTENRIVGRGRATEMAAFRLAHGIPWQAAGTPPPSAGNGSAMRAGPIGLIFFDDQEALVSAAHDQGRITHQDPRCSAGATVIAGAVAHVLTEPSSEPGPFLEGLSDLVKPFDTVFTDVLFEMANWIELEPDEAVIEISKAGMQEGLDEEWPGISPYVVPSVLWSLYSFLRTPDDYWETIATSIAVGGDVDTTAAMAGAISGAKNGIDKVPQELLSHLNDRNTWKVSELKKLAQKAYHIKTTQA